MTPHPFHSPILLFFLQPITLLTKAKFHTSICGTPINIISHHFNLHSFPLTTMPIFHYPIVVKQLQHRMRFWRLNVHNLTLVSDNEDVISD